MIRWFVRRVVKYILEELSGSKDFEAILDRLSIGESGNRYVNVKATPADVGGYGPRTKSGLDSESMSRLAGAVVQRSEGVELSGSVASKADEGGKVSQNAIDRLRKLGD
jgi:hypothetical protein